MIIKADFHNHLSTYDRTIAKNNLFNPALDIAEKRLGFKGILGVCNFSDYRTSR